MKEVSGHGRSLLQSVKHSSHRPLFLEVLILRNGHPQTPNQRRALHVKRSQGGVLA